MMKKATKEEMKEEEWKYQNGDITQEDHDNFMSAQDEIEEDEEKEE